MTAMIDDAIQWHRGVWPYDDHKLLYKAGTNYFTCNSPPELIVAIYVCSKDEFNQRKLELDKWNKLLADNIKKQVDYVDEHVVKPWIESMQPKQINLKPISEAIRCARMHGDNTLISELCNLMDDITMERFKRIERQLWHVMDDIALSDLSDWVAENGE